MDPAIANSVAKRAAEGYCTAMEVRMPETCAEALEMLSYGEGYREIAEATGLTYRQISHLQQRHGEAIAIRREKTATDLENLSDVYREVLWKKATALLEDPEALKRLNPKDAALALAIMEDKARANRGDATVTIEHKKQIGLEEAKRMIEEAQKRVRGEAIDV